MMKKLHSLLMLLLAALLLASCGGNSNQSTANQADDVFDIILNAQPTGFNPLTTNDAMSSDINMQIYETLYVRDVDGVTYKPLLAKALPTCSEDGLECTIQLQEGVKFQDGSPFNAEAVKYTISKIQDKAYGSSRPSIASSIESVEAVNDHEVKLKLKYPDGVLVAKFAHMNSAIISPTSEGKDLMVEPFGTGPYKLVNSVTGSEYDLEVNPEYWGEAPEIKKIKFTVVAEASTAISRLETGEADFMPVVPVTNVNRVKDLASVEFKNSSSSQITYLALRTDTAKNSKVMSDLEARKAMIQAIDREAYVASLEGNVKGLNSILPETVLGYNPKADDYGYKFDLEAAKKTVADLGIANEEITILTNTRPEMQTLGEFIQSSLQKAGFTNVKLVPQEFATYLDTAKKPNEFDLVLLTWANVTGDGTEFFDPNLHSQMSSGRVQYTNPEFDAMVDKSRTSINPEERLAALDEANKIALNDAVVAAMYNPNNLFAYSKHYTNVVVLPGTFFFVKDFKIAK